MTTGIINKKNKICIPSVGLGTSCLGEKTAHTVITQAIHCGYRHIDCAARYKNEAAIGRVFQDMLSTGQVKRKELFITSKLWCTDQSESNVFLACRKTLYDLHIDYLDLYLIHWPVRIKKNESLVDGDIQFSIKNVVETWKALETLVDIGLCRSIGVSNFNISILRELLKEARIKPFVNQVELHPYLPQHKLVQFCQQHEIHVTAYAPLGSPGRSDVYRTHNQPELLEEKVLSSVARKHFISPAQVALVWNIQRGVSVIPKTTNVERLKENLDVAHKVLDSEDIKAIEGITTRCRYFSFPWCQRKQMNFWDDD